MKQVSAHITSNIEVMPDMHLMWIEAPEISLVAQPGQFITVNCEGFTLRRPFSIHQAKQSQIAILFKVVGKGTSWLSQCHKGDKIDIMGPLGNGFTIAPSAKNLLLVAGGIGIAPLVFLAECASPQHSISLIPGASTATELYPLMKTDSSGAYPKAALVRTDSGDYPKEQLITASPSLNVIARSEAMKQSQEGITFIPVTEDGTAGEKGMITDILPRFLDWADQIFACGPLDMYKAMANMSLPANAPSRAKQSNLKIKKCQVSLEVRMGCGIGACYGCTINTKKGLRQVCRDGPVFELDDILWQEVRI